MKLVDILARRLKKWPDGVECLSQLKRRGYIVNGNGFDGRVFDAMPIASETLVAGAIVTRAQWQAAVDALNRVPTKTSDLIDKGWLDPLPPLKNPLPMPNVVPPKQEAIDWPEWATHRLTTGPNWDGDQAMIGSIEFAALRGDSYHDHWGGEFRMGDSSWVVLGERHSVAWNGEGLPPVGTVCECTVSAGAEWVECEVVAHKVHYGATYAIAFVDENTVMLSAGIRFRPTRTPEQIAAEEREKAIEEIRRDTDYILDETCAAAVLAAGYRKQVQP